MNQNSRSYDPLVTMNTITNTNNEIVCVNCVLHVGSRSLSLQFIVQLCSCYLKHFTFLETKNRDNKEKNLGINFEELFMSKNTLFCCIGSSARMS